MNVQVKHNGTSITGFVIEYERVHKICTGIGQLDIEVVDTINRTFKPWDEIDIWENGDFKVRYYVSSVEHNIPRGSIQLSCQDNSKRIVDYFIPDSYTIDYPSYNKYWIDKFLTEAGVDIIWNTSSPGTLLSNYTALGLTTVYEQVISLLQMSGWYMYFDGDGKAVIGSMNIDFAEDFGSVGKTDILNILVTSNDKMLRNKALVFGAYDGYTGTNAKAAVTVHTPWNYDHNDLRTVVISNSNIKDSGTAYSMANQIVKEFARITVEKHITLWGARNYNLGTALRVTSNVWKGRGLITTFGTSMSKQGLVTNVVLDERCPRLFGFFDFGDYVYVAFYGDGVWRKHIKYDPTWYNFSTGLTDLAITDMHINNGVFGAVGASGGAFYAIDSLPWHTLTVSGFASSESDVIDMAVVGSGDYPEKFYSGVMARAVTVDKYGNTVKIAYDTSSGVNYGDYFLEHGIISSGVSVASGGGGDWRSWIVEYDVLAGDVYGTPYPVSLSGKFGYLVNDLDNSGTNDYVSVVTSGVVQSTALGYNFGRYVAYNPNLLSNIPNDTRSVVAYNLFDDFDDITQSVGASVGNAGTMGVFNDESTGEKEIVYALGTTLVRKRIVKTTSLSTSTTTSPSHSYGTPTAISKLGTNLYALLYGKSLTKGTGELWRGGIQYATWDTVTNTISALTTLSDQIVFMHDTTTTSTSYERTAFGVGTFSGKLVLFAYQMVRSDTSTFFGADNIYNYMKMQSVTCDTNTLATTLSAVAQIDFPTTERGSYDGLRCTIEYLSSSNSDVTSLYQSGDSVCWSIMLRETMSTGLYYTEVYMRSWLIYTNDMVTYASVMIEEALNGDKTGTLLGSGSIAYGSAQTTSTRHHRYIRNNTAQMAYVFNGLSVTILTGVTSLPFNWQLSNIWPMFGAFSNRYIAYLSTTDTWYWCNPVTLAVEDVITFPANYDPIKPFSTSSTYSEVYYWQCTNTDTGKIEILRYSSTGYMGTSIKPYSHPSAAGIRGIIAGNFFVSRTTSPSIGLTWLYVDNPNPDISTRIYQVLQRDGTEFKLIQQEIYPIRLDISGNNPVVTVGSGESTFQSNYVYETELVTVQAVPSGVTVASGGNQVNDYRYTYLQPTIGMMSSGGGITSTILYVSRSGIFAADAMSFSGGFTQMFSIPSGEALRIETSNYGIDGQYIFVSASGVMTASGQGQTFYQQDPASFIFYEHATNYPQTRATIIRLDDAM